MKLCVFEMRGWMIVCWYIVDVWLLDKSCVIDLLWELYIGDSHFLLLIVYTNQFLLYNSHIEYHHKKIIIKHTTYPFTYLSTLQPKTHFFFHLLPFSLQKIIHTFFSLRLTSMTSFLIFMLLLLYTCPHHLNHCNQHYDNTLIMNTPLNFYTYLLLSFHSLFCFI